ncbi:MAG: DUF721 domain-containing protein [Kiritimatiellaeota bacterium]|nr:DUF721 domain-containing protein [Kiritimatiellota bacterium]
MNESEFLRRRADAKILALGYSIYPEARPISYFIESAISGITPDVSVIKERIRNDWGDIVGNDIAKRTFPDEVHDGILTLHVAGNVWLAELKNNQASEIIRRINIHLGRNLIKRINFRLAPTMIKGV